MYFLGAVTGLSGAYSNYQQPSGSTGFVVPPGVRAVYLEPNATGVQFEIGVASGTAFLTDAGRGAHLVGPNQYNGPFRTPRTDNPCTVSIYNGTGATVSVRVYADTGET